MRSPTAGLPEVSGGNGNADVEPADDQPAKQGVGGVEHKTGRATPVIWLPSMITRSSALFPCLASIVFGIDWM